MQGWITYLEVHGLWAARAENIVQAGGGSLHIVKYKIDLKKLGILPMRGIEDINMLATVLAHNVGALLSSYLTLPLGRSYYTKSVWDAITQNSSKEEGLF